MLTCLRSIRRILLLNSTRTGIAAAVALLASYDVIAADTGDAPGSYGQASHGVFSGSPWLGDIEPDDNQPVADETALGDDNEGLDDEDGVFAFPVLVENGKSYDTNVFATNPGLVPASLGGWIDFDGNGVFDADEFASATVPAGTVNGKFKLTWPDLLGVTSSFTGTTYARFRISFGSLQAGDAQGSAIDGEVEDYSLEILLDTDGDEQPDITDPDNDNDGIPDLVEGTELDTDNDLTPDYLDVDSDGDFIPDFIEAGSNPLTPVDTDSDGIPDYLDLDSNNDGTPDSQESADDSDQDGIRDDLEGSGDSDNDGILNIQDLDSDNDTIPDAIELGSNPQLPADTDDDGIADFLDLDSDNDGIPDMREANSGEVNVRVLDLDNDGQVDGDAIIGDNGLVDAVETGPDSGIPRFAIADNDQDGVRDFRDLDSDADGVSDLLETGGADTDLNGLVDSVQDSDGDGLVDGSNAIGSNGALTDSNENGVPDFQEDGTDGSQTPDQTPEQIPTSPGRVETGLSAGAGCSISSFNADNQGQGNEWLFSLLTLLSITALFRRRQKRL